MTRTPDTYEFMQGCDDRSDAIHGNASVRSDLVDLMLVLHRATAKAILVSEDGTHRDAVWLPKSQVEYSLANRLTEGERADGRSVDMEVITVALPEWLAKQKGLR